MASDGYGILGRITGERHRGKPMPKSYGMIMDLGASEGNDTAFYLQKGFDVVAVEADTQMFLHIQTRFSREIAEKKLKVLNFAASDTFGVMVNFHVCTLNQGVSGVSINPDVDPSAYKPAYVVQTIDWSTLLSLGTPRYVKIDIENNEEKFLRGMAENRIKPEFISVECHALTPAEALFDLGYRRFALVDQNVEGGFKLPKKQREGNHVSEPNFHHASGPFGLDVFYGRRWVDFSTFKTEWASSQYRRSEGSWFDCHAWRPKALGGLHLGL